MKKSISTLVAAVVLSAAGMAFGQVIQTQGGYSLDANYQVGSGGFNVVNGGMGGVNSQLYITNQVTGLAGFHGHVPSEATNELRVNSVSSSVDRFMRQSANLRQAVQGTGYQTQPYYNSMRTVFGVPGIVTGMTAPGTSAPPGQTSAVAIQRAYADVTKDYQQVIPMTPGLVVQNPPGTMTELPIQVNTSPNILGITLFQDRQALAQELQQLEQAQLPAPGTSNMEMSGQQVGQRANVYDTLNQDQELPVGGQRTRGLRQSDDQEMSQATRGGRIGVPPSNQDVFVDILMGLKQQQTQNQLVQPTRAPEGVPQGQPQEPIQAKGQGAAKGNLVETGPNGVVVHGLAGSSQDLFNQYMNRAQNNLKQGKYYEANRDFEVATVVNDGNPLSRLGSTLALLAAGEPFTASAQLKRAMQVLPPLMETKLDIPSMVNVNDIREELKKLDSQITEQPDEKMLMFLSTYIHYNLGEVDKAKVYAKKLQAHAAGDPLLSVFAQYILTGKRPTAAATPAPAK